MLKIAIVGCGKIAESHAEQIRRIPGCEIAGVCDQEELMAQQFQERFGAKRWFTDLDELLQQVQPHIVHVTTPPGSHFELGRRCLRGGANVYIEKPFTLNTTQAEELVSLANDRKLKLTAGHDYQFRHAARRMRQLVQAGYLGGPPVHMESHFCYELGKGNAYAKALLADKNHWVRKLPGQLLQNIISHGIARIAEFLTTDSPDVLAHGFVSPMLKQLGEAEIIDELRVTICEQERVTAYFTFSSQMRPSLHQFRIYGPRNGLLLDEDNESLVRLQGTRYKSYLQYFVSPLVMAREYTANTARNARLFLARDFHMKSGMKYLIESFYRSVAQDGPLPISYGEILRTSRIMDSIFEQLRLQRTAPVEGAGSPRREIQALAHNPGRP